MKILYCKIIDNLNLQSVCQTGRVFPNNWSFTMIEKRTHYNNMILLLLTDTLTDRVSHIRLINGHNFNKIVGIINTVLNFGVIFVLR